MVELTFVRHGQANTGAQDEESYDQLSETGRQQAQWLGQHFLTAGRGFDHVISGTLNRQRDTAQIVAQQMGLPVHQDARLNEMDYFGLSQSLLDSHAVDFPTDRESFIAHVPQILDVWSRGQIHSHLESFDAFESRISAMIDQADQLGGRVLMVTSGGVIGMAMKILMQLEVTALSKVLLQVYNSSIHRYVKAGDQLVLDTFNAVPHLEFPDRAEKRTHI